MKWQLKHQSQETINFPITQATLTGIRREGKDRGRGQVDGLIWQDVERVCIYAETDVAVNAFSVISVMKASVFSKVRAARLGDFQYESECILFKQGYIP